MIRRFFRPGAGCLVTAVLLANVPAGAQPSPATEYRALLDQYCVS